MQFSGSGSALMWPSRIRISYSELRIHGSGFIRMIQILTTRLKAARYEQDYGSADPDKKNWWIGRDPGCFEYGTTRATFWIDAISVAPNGSADP